MQVEVVEEELLRSIEEVEAKIQNFRRKVRAVLEDAQTESRDPVAATESPPAT